MTITTLALTMLLQTTPPTSTGPVRVYVFTQPTVGGFVDRDSDRRVEAVRHAQAWIGKKERRTIALVDTAAAADITVEVVDVPNDTGSYRTISWWAGLSTTKRMKGDVQVLAKLSVGNYSSEIFTQDKRLRVAGELVGEEVGKWVKANRAKLVAVK